MVQLPTERMLSKRLGRPDPSAGEGCRPGRHGRTGPRGRSPQARFSGPLLRESLMLHLLKRVIGSGADTLPGEGHTTPLRTLCVPCSPDRKPVKKQRTKLNMNYRDCLSALPDSPPAPKADQCTRYGRYGPQRVSTTNRQQERRSIWERGPASWSQASACHHVDVLSLLERLARLGCTRRGSPGIFGYSGG